MLYLLCGFAGQGVGKHLSLLLMAGGLSQGWKCIMRCVVKRFRKCNSGPGEAFGSSHRVYFDTPPLKGYCRGTLVPRCELYQSWWLIEIAFLTRNQLIGGIMPAQSEIRENSLQRLRGRVARSRSIGTKLTPDEEQQIL